jgi:hypothetical protein
MGKRTITRWYIGSWFVWVASVAALVVLAQDNPSMPFVYAALLGSTLVMFVTWVATLVKLARRQATFSFMVMLVLQLLGLGIVGMVLYAISGPEEDVDIAIRPRVT